MTPSDGITSYTTSERSSESVLHYSASDESERLTDPAKHEPGRQGTSGPDARPDNGTLRLGAVNLDPG